VDERRVRDGGRLLPAPEHLEGADQVVDQTATPGVSAVCGPFVAQERDQPLSDRVVR
jgi:hypothetical protein